MTALPEELATRVGAARSLIAAVADFPEPGITFRDISPLLADGAAFDVVVSAFAALCPAGVTKVVGIEARGFIFGAAVAARNGAGFVPIRKPGKLPRDVYHEEYSLEYGPPGRLEMHSDALGPADSVVLIDDVLATGGTAAAAARLIDATGADLVSVMFLIELEALHGRRQLAGRPIQALLQY